MRQVETYLLQKHYDGFLRKGRIRGRFDRPGTGGPLAGANLTWLFVVLAIIILAVVVFQFSGAGQLSVSLSGMGARLPSFSLL